MVEDFFWDCVDEHAPFGSDEGATAYDEWRRWREDNPSRPLTECLSWILSGRLEEYNESLCKDERIAADLENPEGAFLSDSYDIFTLDTTVIGAALGQLLDEGVIDIDAKPYVRIAVTRQLSPLICRDDERREILNAVRRVVEAA